MSIPTDGAAVFLRAGIVSAILLFVASPGPSAPATAETAHVDFSGEWELDKSLSDDPRAKMQEAMEARQRALAESGGTGFDAGMSGGMGGAGDDRAVGGGRRAQMPDREEMQRQMRALSDSLELMEIEQHGATLTIRYADGRERELYTDGKKHHRQGGTGDLETRTKWKNERQLVVKATTERGQKLVETWEMGPDGTFLYIDTYMKADDSRPDLEIRRVYRLRNESTESDLPD